LVGKAAVQGCWGKAAGPGQGCRGKAAGPAGIMLSTCCRPTAGKMLTTCCRPPVKKLTNLPNYGGCRPTRRDGRKKAYKLLPPFGRLTILKIGLQQYAGDLRLQKHGEIGRNMDNCKLQIAK
jgi:hypothetical protein